MLSGSYPTSGVRNTKKTRGCLSSVKSWFTRQQAPVSATQIALSTLVLEDKQPQTEMPMAMLRLPTATPVRPGREVMRHLPAGNYIYDLQSFPRVPRSLPGPRHQNAKRSDESSRTTEKELCTFLQAVATGQANCLPSRPDLGFRYNTTAMPPNVRFSILPSPIVAKTVLGLRTVLEPRNVSTARRALERRPVSTRSSFKFPDSLGGQELQVHQVQNGTPSIFSTALCIVQHSEDSDDDDKYEYGTVIQDRMNKKCVDTAVSSEPTATPQPRQAGEHMELSTSSSEDEGGCNQGRILQARQQALSMLSSGASIVDEDDRRIFLSDSSSEDDAENECIAMVRPVSYRRALSVDSESLSGSSVESEVENQAIAMVRPVSRRRALSIDSNASSVGFATSAREHHANESSSHAGVVTDEAPTWLDLNPECTAMLFASPSEGCMERFTHLWDDPYAGPIDQCLFADFDASLSDVTSETSSDRRCSSWSASDETLSCGHSIQATDISTDSRCNSWSVGDEENYGSVLIPGRGHPTCRERFLPLPVAQTRDQAKYHGRPRRTFNEFYQLRRGRTFSTVPNGWYIGFHISLMSSSQCSPRS